MLSRNIVYLCAIGVMLSSCGTNPVKPASQHIQQPATPLETESSIPQTIRDSVVLPPPKPAGKVATYSVVVTNVPAQEILFALARDAKINLDIQSGIQGAVTVNAINQALPQILDRISRQVDMRYEINNGTLTVMPDTPYLHSYKIDYVNMDRDSNGSISNSSMVGSSTAGGTAGGSTSGSSSSSGGNNESSLVIKNNSKNHFWETLTQNIKDILHETDKILPAGSSETSVEQVRSASSTGTGAQPAGGKKSAPKGGIENSPNPVDVEEGNTTVIKRSTFREAASVIANPEAGVITVRATGKQHEKIQQFIDQIMVSARRQVLIEATIVEVRLSDNYQQGIDWSVLATGAKGFSFTQSGAGLPAANTGSLLTMGYLNPTSKFGNITASISLLQSFGNVKVLSSPKLSVMNNQTAMLRVVDNKVYFTVNSTVTPCSPAPCSNIVAYTTTVSTVPIGFTMSVTPEISDSDTVLINIRPSITRLLTDAIDPTPGLAVQNTVPQTSTREMESMLKIESNQTAVLGGLMEDSSNKLTDEVPLLAKIPLIGGLFQNRNDTTSKTELVIFLRPVVVKSASIDADYREFRDQLPDQNFFKENAEGKPGT